mmetsp:Transcript_25335/g.37879  ORF Transcript_25335/g.37879 Transcript_25335/m.37879 type:complete len:198 (-) Transcript_25335:198-791(-)
MILYLLTLAIALHAARGQTIISPEEFYNGIQSNAYDAIIDVRTLEEWNDGHIANATHVESLQLQTSIPDDILGCEGWCRTIVVYCRSGSRAGVAIELMLESGFNGTIYNGQGVSQWTAAGYGLVNTESNAALCSVEVENVSSCSPLEAEPSAPSSMPSNQPVMSSSSSAEQSFSFNVMSISMSFLSFEVFLGLHLWG